MDELAQALNAAHDATAMTALLKLNPHLQTLPSPLLAQLGAAGQLQWLRQRPHVPQAPDAQPQLTDIPAELLCQNTHDQPYPLHHSEQGLSLTLQCLNPTASPPERRWGLHSFMIHAQVWQGPWFEGIKPAQTTAQELIERLGETEEEIAHQGPVLCMGVTGLHGQAWSAVAVWDEATGELDTFCLIRVGDWREEDPVPETAAQQPQQPAAQEELAPQARTCRSGQPTPAHGVWEASLPEHHPQAALYAQAPHRFVYRRAGDAMGVLGLPAEQEAWVTWRWVRAG